MGKIASQGMFGILIVFMLSVPLYSQVWDTIPPPLGGMVLSTVRSGSMHYALLGSERSDMQFWYYANLYRSSDDGEHWEPMSLPLTGTKTAWCNRLALDGSDCLYYQNENGVYRTTDGGTTWTDIGASLNCPGSIMEIVVDASGRLYLLSLSIGIVTSIDRGNTWTSCTLPSKRRLMSVSTHLACIQEDLFQWWDGGFSDADTLFRSIDHGTSWSPFLIGRNPRAVIDGGNGRVLVSQVMLGTGVVPFRILSTNSNGQKWDTLYSAKSISGYSESVVERSVFRRSETGTLAHVIHDSSGAMLFLISVDDGATWSTFENRSCDYYDAVSFNARGQLLIYGSNLGFFRDRSITGDLERIGVIPLSMNHPPVVTSDGKIYAPSEQRRCARIYMWDMSVLSWTMLEGPSIRVLFGRRESTSLFVAPPDTIFTTNDGLARTTDQGRHWETIRPADRIFFGNTSYATGRWFAVSTDLFYLSDDNGGTWTAISPPEAWPPARACVVECSGNVLFLSPTGLWRKSSPDSAWIGRITPFALDAVTTGMDGLLFIRNPEGTKIARSSDLGDSWENLTAGFGSVHGLLALTKDTLIALDTTRGLAISPDRGNSWTLFLIPGVRPRSIAMKDGMLYIGTERLGILRTALTNVLATISPQQPLDNADCLPMSVQLSWDVAPSLPGPFRIRCGTDPSFTSGTLLLDTLVLGSTLSAGNLSPGTTYFWEVSTAQGQFGSLQSVVRQFRTASILSAAITSPASDETCVESNREIVWAIQACMEYSELEISPDSGFQTVDFAQRLEGETNTASFALAYGTRYYARVRSTSVAGTGTWSAAISFRTIDSVMAAPMQVQPLDQSTFTVSPPDSIKWDKVDCVRKTEIVVSRVQNFSTDTVAHTFRQDPYNNFDMYGGQWRNGTYYWKVRAWRDTVPGFWSPTWSFTLDIPVGIAGTPEAESFGILQVYPVPAGNSSTLLTVEYRIISDNAADLLLYDALGRKRLRTSNVHSASGGQRAILDVSALPAGEYFLVLRSGSRSDVRPLQILR